MAQETKTKQRKQHDSKKKNESEKEKNGKSENHIRKKSSGGTTGNNIEEPIAGGAKNSAIKIDFKRIIIKCLVILGMIIVVSFTQQEVLETFASQKEEIEAKSANILCSNDYNEELNKFPGCVPKKCGRFVSDKVVSQDEVAELLRIAGNGISLGGSSGGASILDLHSGALSRGDSFVNVYSIDKTHKVITAEDLGIYKRVKDKIKNAIVKHFGINPRRLHLTHPTFFSHITSQPAKTIHDEYWHPHVDKETYKSFHYTSLLYLTDYKVHFKGGRFVFIDKDANRTVEPRVGRLSAFTSGSENLHYVEPVMSGSRYAITVSFTCDPEQGIKDPQIRERDKV